MRAGRYHIGFLVTMIIAIVVIMAVTAIFGQVFEGAEKDLESLEKCQGLIGSLGGGEGRCHTDSSCGTVDAPVGMKWQPIGQGFGCPEESYCCLSVNDPLARDDVSVAKCEAVKPGSIVIVTEEEGITGCFTEFTVDPTKKVVVGYVAEDREAECVFTAEIRHAGGSIPYPDEISGDCDESVSFGAPFRLKEDGTDIDRSLLNEDASLHVTVTTDGTTTETTFPVAGGLVNWCPRDRGVEECRNRRVGSRVGTEYCYRQDAGGRFSCDLIEPLRCKDVLGDSSKGNPCFGVMFPESVFCYVEDQFNIYVCEAKGVNVCEEGSKFVRGGYEWDSVRESWPKCG